MFCYNCFIFIKENIFAADAVKIKIDDKVFDGINKNGEILIPVRDVFENLNLLVTFDDFYEPHVNIRNGFNGISINDEIFIDGKGVNLNIGQKEIYIDGQKKFLNQLPEIIDDKIFVGLELIDLTRDILGISYEKNNDGIVINKKPGEFQIESEHYSEEKKTLVQAIRFMKDHPNIKYPKEQKNLNAWENIKGSYQRIRGRWSSNYTNLLYGLKELKNIRILPGAVAQYEEILGPAFAAGGKKGDWYELKACQEGGLLDRLKKIQYDVSMTFMNRCVPVMEQALREKGGLTYFDFLFYLRNMLRKDAEGDGKLIRLGVFPKEEGSLKYTTVPRKERPGPGPIMSPLSRWRCPGRTDRR